MSSQKRVSVSTEEIDFFSEASMGSNASESVEELLPLLWTDEEELVADAHPMGRASSWLRLAALLLAVSSAAAGLVKMLRAGTMSPATSAKSGKRVASPMCNKQSLDSHWV